MYYHIGNLDKSIYCCIANDITTEEVIITKERIEHIDRRHPGHFTKIFPYLADAIREPDYILEDSSNTALVLKLVERKELRFEIVLRLQTSGIQPGLKNTILSAWQISEKRWDNYLRNKNILYRCE